MPSSEKKYKWASPGEWLLDYIKDWEADGNYAELAEIARLLVGKTDSDTIQDIFQSDMSDDGYFKPIGEEDDGEEEDE